MCTIIFPFNIYIYIYIYIYIFGFSVSYPNLYPTASLQTSTWCLVRQNLSKHSIHTHLSYKKFKVQNVIFIKINIY
jgi:ABC-type polysaccharide transport system permease subunit